MMTISLSTYKTRSHLTGLELSDGALYTPNQNQSTSHTPTVIYANIKFEEKKKKKKMTRRKTKINIS